MTPAVVVSGLGCVGPFGVGAEALARGWRGGIAPIEIDRSAGFHRPGAARRALAAADLDLAGLVPGNLARRMSPPARFAVAATRLALADAGLAGLDAEAHATTAVVVGTAFGPASVTEQLVSQIFRQGPENVSPALFTESVASASAAQIALVFKTRGPSLAVTEREASDLLALAEGARLVASGAAERALVVVVDEMVPLLHAVLGRFRALARPERDGGERARPFDRRRSGALASEGATVVVLESEAAASRRGRAAYARLVALARGFDPSAPGWDYGSGDEPLARTLARGLERAGCAPGTIELVVSGASGAVRGDRLEAAILRRIFPEPPPVVAPKGALGGWGGGHLAAALLAASGRALGPTSGFEEVDPELGIRPAAAAELPARPARTLVSSLASGGAAAWLVLEGGQPAPAAPV